MNYKKNLVLRVLHLYVGKQQDCLNVTELPRICSLLDYKRHRGNQRKWIIEQM